MSHAIDQTRPEAAMDLTQFYQVFFEEAAENLDTLEQLLVALDTQAPDDETLNAIFRCAHSVKGGAAAFGFAEIAALTHTMESLLDRLRRHEIAVEREMVDELLLAGDVLRAMLLRRQCGEGEAVDAAPVQARLERLAQAGSPALAAVATPAHDEIWPAQGSAGQAGPVAAGRDLELVAGPLAHASLAGELLELFAEVGGAGTLSAADPAPGQDPACARFRLVTTSTDSELLDLCGFHVPREQIRISPWPAPAAISAPPAAKRVAAAVDATIRVAVDKVDQLINLMGELVITQAMLSQRAQGLDRAAQQKLMPGLTALERTTRDLQDSVMSIRMIPMAEVFNRFPRMLRDLAGRLGKQVEFATVGEATELDKGLIEKITDPLTHLVRNALDHGIELPAQRVAAGKPPQGTLTLSAQHSGGCILIQVRDDGRGLDRERILAKARDSGLPLPPRMSDAEVWQLIFAPGFSTAEVVTDVSGRGVGMDVVKRNILSLGGTVELESVAGKGTCVSVRLPLTLAIMDGMSVSVGAELYILPLAAVVESFQAQPAALKRLAGEGLVVQVRGEWLPVLPLGDTFQVEHPHAEDVPRMLVIVEAEGRRVALQVGRLVGQQQVVVKNLEANYRKVPNVSGATIMGDGSVALILDVAALVRPRAHAG